MPDTKLSALGAVSNPVVGTDTIYLVRAGASYKTTVADLPASGSVATDAIWDAAGDLVQGTGANTAARLALGTANQVLQVNAGATAVEWTTLAAGGDMVLANVQTVTGAKTFGGAGAVGKLKVAGTTSGATILDATAVAGAGTVTLPTTGTLATLAGTEALTNKTVNKVTLTEPATGSTLTIAEGKTLTNSNTLTLTATDGSTLAIGTGGTLGTAAYTAATAYQAADADLTTWAGITPGANVGTALAVAVGTDGAFVVKAGALGTPNGGTLTNCTGLPTAGIVDDAVTYAKIQNVSATSRVLGRIAGGAGDVEELTGANIKTIAAITPADFGAGVLAANMTLGEADGQIVLDAALSATEKFSGILEVVTAGETLAIGELVYFKAADSRWWKTDADASATAGPVKIGICVTTGAAAGALTVLLWGKVRVDAVFPAMTVGAPLYVGLTAGAIAVTETWGTDDVIRIIGHANTADELFFHPSNDYITYV